MIISDKHICSLLVSGDKRGMQLLFQKYFENLVIWADSFLEDMDLSQDIVQSLFIHIWKKKIYKNINPEKLSSFLRTAVRNRCLNQLKKNDILKYSEDISVLEDVFDDYQLDKERIVDFVLKEIEALPPKGREVIKNVYLKGMKYKEAAEFMNVSVSTIKTHLVNSLKTLRLKSNGNSDLFILLLYSLKDNL